LDIFSNAAHGTPYIDCSNAAILVVFAVVSTFTLVKLDFLLCLYSSGVFGKTVWILLSVHKVQVRVKLVEVVEEEGEVPVVQQIGQIVAINYFLLGALLCEFRIQLGSLERVVTKYKFRFTWI